MKSAALWTIPLCAMVALPMNAQNNKQNNKGKQREKQEVVAKSGEGSDTNLGKANNMMMNASEESEPRFINVGLPDLPNGGVVAENGMLVSGDNYVLKNNQAWRQDGSFKKPTPMSFSETAMRFGASVVGMSTDTRQGTKNFRAQMNIGTNSFGKMSGNLSLAGPINNGWFYHVNVFANYNPETTRSQALNYKDQVLDVKGLLTKCYKGGEFNFQYKYIGTHKLQDNFCPYIFNSDDKNVTELDNFKIGHDSYLKSTRDYYWMNPKTGKKEWVDIWDDIAKSDVHAFDFFGKQKLNKKGLNLDWGVRYQYGKSGFANMALNKTLCEYPATTHFYYANNKNDMGNVVDGVYKKEYTGGAVQNLMCGLTAPTTTHLFTERLELSKKNKKWDWSLGLSGMVYNIQDFTQSSFNSFLSVEPNPQQLIRVNKGVALHDEYGNTQYNAQMLYLAGTETKQAIYGMTQIRPVKGLKVDLGARFEYYGQCFDYSPASARKNNALYIETDKSSDKCNIRHQNNEFFNKSFTATVTYNIKKNFGIVADAYRLEVGNPMNAYKGKEEDGVNGFCGSKTSTVPYFAGGVFLNSKAVELISRVYYISRDNIAQQGNFNYTGKDSSDPTHPHSSEAIKMGFMYGVKTLGWTTDAIIRPFKGFQFHCMVTIQDPKYFDFKFTLPETTYKQNGQTVVQPAETYDYDGVVARSVSKFLLELDPSYSFKKYRVWASFRYFSKQAAVMPGTMFFPSRWETFAGADYQATKKVSFSLSMTNLFNQSGAQGRIIGTNTLQDYELADYLGKTVNGTFIRPFTVDLKMKIAF